MRFFGLASLFAVCVSGLVRAEEAAAPAAAAAAGAAATGAHSIRLVGVILSSAQALLWDDELGEYVIHKVGDPALGGRLVELDADHVVVERGESREVIELSAPPQLRVVGRRQPKRMPAMIISAVPEAGEKASAQATIAPIDGGAPSPTPVSPAPAVATAAPTATAAPAPVAAVAATTTPAPVVAPAPPAPISAVAAPRASVATAQATPSATPSVAAPVAPSAPETATVVTADTADRKPVATTVLIPRAELDRELGDFAALSQQVQVAAQPEGGFRLAQVRSGSFFERIGLRTNDVVLRIDGRPINGVEDASAAYAWLRVTSKFTVDVVRDGHPLTLRYVIAPAQPMSASAQ